MMVLFSSTIGNVLWVLLAVTLAMPYVMTWWRKRRRIPEEQLEEQATPALTEGG
jgi:hypothetical protein